MVICRKYFFSMVDRGGVFGFTKWVWRWENQTIREQCYFWQTDLAYVTFSSVWQINAHTFANCFAIALISVDTFTKRSTRPSGMGTWALHSILSVKICKIPPDTQRMRRSKPYQTDYLCFINYGETDANQFLIWAKYLIIGCHWIFSCFRDWQLQNC